MNQPHLYRVTTFYRFQQLEASKLEQLRLEILEEGERLNLCGLFLLGEEGFNATVAGEVGPIEDYKNFVQQTFGGEPLFFKDSPALKKPFRQLRVKVREEIVTLGRPDLVPLEKDDSHLPPHEWHKWLQKEGIQVVDTRNDYEVEIGKFKQAIDFKISEFQEFPERVKNSDLKKDQPVLIYCTGGIRCEKAILEMKEQGFKEVKQLEGGIINYLKEFPQGDFEGECFVFDHRVAVNPELKPSETYTLCPHCGQPAKDWIECLQCGTEERVCPKCREQDKRYHTCSKNCAHHYAHGHRTSRIHLDELKKRGRIS